MNRTCSSGTMENSSDTSPPIVRPCSAALHVTPYFDIRQQRRGSGTERERNGADGEAGQQDTQQAARQSQREDLQEVDRDDFAAAGAQALQDGDAANLLKNEDAGDARDGDAAEDDDDQADEAQVVLGAIEVAADLILVRAVRPHVGELVAQLGPQGRRPARRSDPPAL